MKYEFTERLVLALQEAADEGRKALRIRAALAAQALLAADTDHDEHDEEESPTVH